MRNQRKYDKEFKLNTAKHYEAGERPMNKVAQDLGIPITTLLGWIKEYKEHGEKN